MCTGDGHVIGLTRILETNWIILYFVYGQVFFITGLVTGLQWRRRSQLDLARTLPWLAAFGITHGLNEWGYIFIPFQALYLAEPVVRVMVIGQLLLLAVSFFALFQFGIELILLLVPGRRWLRGLPAMILLLWGIAVLLRMILRQDSLDVLVAIGDGWSRYLLAFPGAILAHLGLLHQARRIRHAGLPRIALYFTGAALAFSLYAIVGGLLVPTSPLFPENLLNYTFLDRWVHIPAPVFRSFCGLAMAFFVVRSFEVFEVEVDRRLEEMEHAQLLSADRERIGRELHDGIIQNIYAAGLTLEDTSHLVVENPGLAQHRIHAVMDALDRAIYDIRRYIFDLRDTEQTRELEAVLEGLIQDMQLDTFLAVDLEVEGQRCCVLSHQHIAHITQIIREALSNIVQHARASQVTLTISYQGDHTCLRVKDNGQGINSDAPNGRLLQGQGIANMQARARMMNGDLHLDSNPGQGLTLELIIPCRNGTDGDKVLDITKQGIWI
jgi:signal transduction histidine kinase